LAAAAAAGFVARMNALIDTHTHLEVFARRGETAVRLERAREAGVGGVLTVGTSPEDWELYRGLAKEHPGIVRYSAGLHPCNVDENWEAALDALEAFWTDGGEKPAAIGEMGLDRFHLPADAAAAERLMVFQKAAFAEGLRVAKSVGAPIIVHSRKAFAECVEIIDKSGADWGRVVFHCFSEGPAELRELARRGGRASFTGVLTYKNAESVRAAALEQGLDRLMIETDAPWLAPVPLRGKENEPAFLRHTAEAAARLFNVPLAELQARTTAAAESFFGAW
jgi:TatD DNase family protein